MNEYEIFEEYSKQSLRNELKPLLSSGWVCVGGVSVCCDFGRDKIRYFQAIQYKPTLLQRIKAYLK